MTALNTGRVITFPDFTGIRCLMMPYIQGEPDSVPEIYDPYRDIIGSVFLRRGDIGFLTIDESLAVAGKPHRGDRAQYDRALHTEAGKHPTDTLYLWGSERYGWGSPAPKKPNTWGWGSPPSPDTFGWGGSPSHRWGWGSKSLVTLDRDVKILLANSIDDTCAVWNAEHEDTSLDGDIGHVAHDYPYRDAVFLKSGEVHEIGILTPHESLPVREDCERQFLRIISSGVHGREPYFTENPLVTLN